MTKVNLYDLGLSPQQAEEAAAYGGDLSLARVSAQHKNMYRVITEVGEMVAGVSGRLGYLAAGQAEYPAVGDWVMADVLGPGEGNAVIHHILGRRTCLQRKAAGTGNAVQVIAANIDTLFICMSLTEDYNLRRAERYLAIAWDSMATPVLVLTKADRCPDTSTRVIEVESVAPGVDVVVTSSLSDEGLAPVRRYLRKGQTVGFIGSSGVGKSTMINRLMNKEVLATGEMRAGGKGRHTTTHREMLVLPEGGVVIDTPGMREIQVASADLSRSFEDIEELAKMCHFRDCRHESEPKCAVKEAVRQGTLSPGRLENYRKLQREMLFEERKGTISANQAEKQKIIDMMGSLNAIKQFQKDSRRLKGGR
jgi:ribosome biogenesis GTPase